MRKRLLTKKSEEIIKKSSDSLKTATVHTVGLLKPVAKSPDESLRDLFDAVQAENVFVSGRAYRHGEVAEWCWRYSILRIYALSGINLQSG